MNIACVRAYAAAWVAQFCSWFPSSRARVYQNTHKRPHGLWLVAIALKPHRLAPSSQRGVKVACRVIVLREALPLTASRDVPSRLIDTEIPAITSFARTGYGNIYHEALYPQKPLCFVLNNSNKHVPTCTGCQKTTALHLLDIGEGCRPKIALMTSPEACSHDIEDLSSE